MKRAGPWVARSSPRAGSALIKRLGLGENQPGKAEPAEG